MEFFYLWIEQYGQISRQVFETSAEFCIALSEDNKVLRIERESSFLQGLWENTLILNVTALLPMDSRAMEKVA
jgi:hypothetical protein